MIDSEEQRDERDAKFRVSTLQKLIEQLDISFEKINPEQILPKVKPKTLKL